MKVAIISGSVYGAAEEVARRAATLLEAAGFEAWHGPGAKLAEVLDSAPDAILAVISTTGMGELPYNIEGFYHEVRDSLPQALAGRPFAVLALGDSSYEIFCGAGEQIREVLLEVGMREIQPMLRLDASESVNPEEDALPWGEAFVQALRSEA
ncbi:flavodoxin [Pseudomonas sp. LRF_L74]|uniref:flavodoxin n=1 Tax=Pseudomonas sp. LRF_L74 TaxID=3369422 RepID=UPI003F5F75D1